MTLLKTSVPAKRAVVEQRQSLRRTTNCSAWIEFCDHAQPRTCTIVDISTGGMRIAIASPDDLPNQLLLIFSFGGGKITRRVRIVWRAESEIGVRYVLSTDNSR